jgi:tetratricopeptide (TPR) repeat protein
MKVFSLILLTLGFSHLFAQENSLQSAFEKSYALEKTANYNEAAQSLMQVYNEKSYEVNLRLGYLKYMAGAYNDALLFYKKAIQVMPYAIEPRLGFVYPAAALNRWDDVVTQYQAILKIDPKNSNVNYKLGVIYYNRKKYAQAYVLFERVVNLYPFDYDALLMYAWTNYRMGKLAQAKNLFKKVLLASPYDKSALDGLALIK